MKQWLKCLNSEMEAQRRRKSSERASGRKAPQSPSKSSQASTVQPSAKEKQRLIQLFCKSVKQTKAIIS